MTDETGRIKIEIDASDATKAKKELDNLTDSVEGLDKSTQENTKTFVQAQREFAALEQASRETKKAVGEVEKSLKEATQELKSLNSTTEQTAKTAQRSWQEVFAAQNKLSKNYHDARVASEKQAEAEIEAAIAMEKNKAEAEKKKVALQKLLGVIDKTEKALSVLDTQELELTKHFKEGRIGVEAYNNALDKINAKRNALTTIKKEAKATTQEVNKLSQAVKSLAGIATTAFAGYGVISFGKAVIETSLQWQKAETIMRNATGSAGRAARELDHVKEISSKLNLELMSTTTSYSRLLAAAKNTPQIANEMHHIFESISEAATSLQLNPNEFDNVLTIYERMISKGKVQVSDLNQLANYIPGIFDKAAKALGTNQKQMAEWISKGLVPASELLPRLSDVLHSDFSESAKEASQGLQGQLNSLTNAWTELKKEAGNAGFIDTFTEALKGLTEVLKDPTVKEGLNDLIKGLGEIVKFSAWSAPKVSSAGSFLLEATTPLKKISFDNPDISNNIAAIHDKVGLYEKAVNDAKNRLARLSSKSYQPGAVEGILQFFTSTTVDEEIADAQKSLTKFEGLLQKYLSMRDALEVKLSTSNSNSFTDPLVEGFKKAQADLKDVQQKIAEQIRTGNGQVDIALQEQEDSYQNTFNQANKLIQDKYDELTGQQEEASNQLVALQEKYAKEAESLTEAQKLGILGQINSLKETLNTLNTEVAKYQPYVSVTTRPAFVPDQKGKKGKTDAQKKADKDESYVKSLEKQAATLELTAAEIRRYELAEKNLTGTELKRAEAALALLDANEKKLQQMLNANATVQLQIELMRSLGDETGAATLEMQSRMAEMRKEFEKAGNTEGLSLLPKVEEANKAKIAFDSLKQSIDKVYENQNRKEQSIQALVQTGQITQYEGQKRITALQKETAEIIKKSLPDLEKMAQIPGVMGEQARNYLADLNNQLIILQTTTSELENAFRNGLQDGIQSSIDGLVKGTMNLQDALLNFVNTIASSVLNTVIQEIASEATGSLMNGLKGLGGIFGIEAEETAPQATAIVSASEQGALAMQTSIERGSIIAAQNMANAINGNIANTAVVNPMATAEKTSEAVKEAGEVAGQSIGQSMLTAGTNTASGLAASFATGGNLLHTGLMSVFQTAVAMFSALFASQQASDTGAAILKGAIAGLTGGAGGGGGGGAQKKAAGGIVLGAGTGTSDSIPAWLSNGEFVTKASVVKQPGMLPILKMINEYGRSGLNAYAHSVGAVKHSTGGLAGVPAPNLSSFNMPSMLTGDLPENNNSTTLKNSINLIAIEDPNKVADKIANHGPTRDAIETYIIENNQTIKQILQS